MRICHLSDLHFGHHDARVAEGLADDLAAQRPDIVVVSGDFTQLGSESEFRAARAFLDTLEAPVFAVPGNHDVPAVNLMRRFLDPYGLYRRYIDTELEPFVELGGVAIAGLKTSRRLRAGLNWAHGAINRGQLRRLAARFDKASPDALRVVVAHHPLMQPETAGEKPMRLVKRADQALETFSELGVRLVLSGHFHLSYVRKHERPGSVAEGAPQGLRQAASAPILVAQASSTISTRLRGEPNGYNLIDIENGQISVTVRDWSSDQWVTRETASGLT
ncbi:metallophosphoesterase [Devosia sp. Root413D1]|uniref:metallophosphoesterase family protein n=1 Tax=Devosia sp. Root413D1 TaxID=1736531 RepID=UPI0006F4439C|nr:metallophosphoesterase [Devosia sp. Root413D1]KQW74093.1 metallophosphoesterase [Devosia sp. Root413D1]